MDEEEVVTEAVFPIFVPSSFDGVIHGVGTIKFVRTNEDTTATIEFSPQEVGILNGYLDSGIIGFSIGESNG